MMNEISLKDLSTVKNPLSTCQNITKLLTIEEALLLFKKKKQDKKEFKKLKFLEFFRKKNLLTSLAHSHRALRAQCCPLHSA